MLDKNHSTRISLCARVLEHVQLLLGVSLSILPRIGGTFEILKPLSRLFGADALQGMLNPVVHVPLLV